MDKIENRLYKLLPNIYRKHDQEDGNNKPLQQLLAAMEQVYIESEAIIARNYDNCFIETCDKEVIPALADLVGGLSKFRSDIKNVNNIRLLIANTVHYRKRKGQSKVIEEIANAITGYTARLVNCRDLLAMTQSIRYPRLGKSCLTPVRDRIKMQSLYTVFDKVAHTAQVLTTSRYQKQYAINALQLFLFPFTSHPAKKITVKMIKVNNVDNVYYTFNPLGIDQPLFCRPGKGLLPQPINAENFFQSAAESNLFYGDGCSFFIRYLTDEKEGMQDVSIKDIVLVDLEHWDSHISNKDKVMVDVKRGRIKLGKPLPNLSVDYHYGASAALGGGYYPRNIILQQTKNNTYFITCIAEETSALLTEFNKEDNKYDEWVIEINNNGTAIIDLDALGTLTNKKKKITIQAANYQCPCLQFNNDILILQAGIDGILEINVNGLLINGAFKLYGKVNLNIMHSTLVPKKEQPSISINEIETNEIKTFVEKISIKFSIVGKLYLPYNYVGTLQIEDSIVDNGGKVAISGNTDKNECAKLYIEKTTVLGSINAKSVSLFSENIVTHTVFIKDLENALIQYSYITLDSNIQQPQKFNCQPITKENKILPIFISTLYGQPGYAKLSQKSSKLLLCGGKNNCEIGAFHMLSNTKRIEFLKKFQIDYLTHRYIEKINVNLIEV